MKNTIIFIAIILAGFCISETYNKLRSQEAQDKISIPANLSPENFNSSLRSQDVLRNRISKISICPTYKVFKRTIITSSTRGQISDTGWLLNNEFTSCGDVTTGEKAPTCRTQLIPGHSVGQGDEFINTCIVMKTECFVNCDDTDGDISVEGKISGCEAGKGSIDLTVNGGSGNYAFEWKRNGIATQYTTQNITNIPNGNYSVKVTDNNSGKSASEDFKVNISRLSVITTTTDANCGLENGKIEFFKVSGGIPKESDGKQYYDYTLDRIGPDPVNIKKDIVEKDKKLVISNTLKAGVYKLTVSDANVCNYIRSITIDEKSNIAFLATARDVMCPEDSTGQIIIGASSVVLTFKLTGPNGFFKETVNAKSFDNLKAGNYVLEGYDPVSKCTKIKNLTISVDTLNKEIRTSITAVTNADGDNGSITLFFTKKMPLSLTVKDPAGKDISDKLQKIDADNAYALENLKQGSYTYTVKYTEKCIKTVSYEVPACGDPSLTVEIVGGNVVTKAEKTFTLKIKNAKKFVKYSWSSEDKPDFKLNGQRNVNAAEISIPFNVINFPVGIYTVEVTDDRGCKDVTDLNVIEKPICKADPNKWKKLNIKPVYQKTPVWCWLANGEMVFTYYGIPNVNPGGVYQCGIIAVVLGGKCAVDCRQCIVPAGDKNNVIKMIKEYSKKASNGNKNLNVTYAANVLTIDNLKKEIDAGRPVIAGISPSGNLPANGASEHVALIIGYNISKMKDKDGEKECLILLVNDPFPFEVFGANPYVKAGGTAAQKWSYEIEYNEFINKLIWRESFYRIQ